jgi:hypothetical protein
MDGIAKARASCGAGSEHADRRIYGWRSQELPSAEQDEMAAIAAVKRALYELPNLELLNTEPRTEPEHEPSTEKSEA